MNKYKLLGQDEIDEMLSNYLIDSWSYSKVRSFASNEKAFEMQYIYRCYGKSSATTIAGQAYHGALCLYFLNLKDGIVTDLIDLQSAAYKFIEDIPATWWKIQKTTPTIEECRNAAVKSVTQLLANFINEVKLYTDEIAEVLHVEKRFKVWIRVNGVDIPMPVTMELDLVIRTNDNKKVIIDHKSKKAFTDEDEIRFTSGKQAIIYVLGYEEEMEETIDEVWFIENKQSQNKDKSPQLVRQKTVMDDKTRRLYEALLYEPLKRMISAVGDPDYVYMINDNDNLTDKAELYDFWARTMIAEVDDFNIPENKKALLKSRMRKIRDSSLATITPTVLRNFKAFTEEFIPYDFTNKNMTAQEKIEHILRSFGIITKVQYTFDGFSSATYLLSINAGVPIATIQKYRLDIANALDVPNVRIQKDLFVYEGKSYLAIESSTRKTALLAWSRDKLSGNRIPVGIDNLQQTIVWDMDNSSTPHMLVCGATGSGKSVFLKSTIEYALLAGVKDVYIFDPKHEFTQYAGGSITVATDIEDIEALMKMLVEDMEGRVKSHANYKTLVIFDEFADAVANSRKGNALKKYEMVQTGLRKDLSPKMERVLVDVDKSLEENLRILLQKGRSSGFRIIAATQRASTKVITGDAKVNFQCLLCFRVPKDIDSIVVLDEPGAEALNGRGDGLFKSPEYLNMIRFQGFYKE